MLISLYFRLFIEVVWDFENDNSIFTGSAICTKDEINQIFVIFRLKNMSKEIVCRNFPKKIYNEYIIVFLVHTFFLISSTSPFFHVSNFSDMDEKL